MTGQVKAVNGNIGSGRFMSGENDPNFSNEAIVVAITTILLPAGTVLGRVNFGAQAIAAPVAGAGNVGNGVFTVAPTADANIPAGDYVIEVIGEVANAGRLRIENPDGSEDGVGNVAVAYNGKINFTLGDGATDWKIGDRFVVTVSYAAGSGQYKPYDATAHDGTETAVGILWHDAPINTGTQKNVMLARHGVVNQNLLTWAVAADTNQKAAAIAALATKGIIVRP